MLEKERLWKHCGHLRGAAANFVKADVVEAQRPEAERDSDMVAREMCVVRSATGKRVSIAEKAGVGGGVGSRGDGGRES